MINETKANHSFFKSVSLRSLFPRILLLLFSLYYIWAGLTRFIEATVFPFTSRPQHYIFLALGIFEIALGTWFMFIRRNLIYRKNMPVPSLIVSSVFVIFHYILRRIVYKLFHQVPTLLLRWPDIFWLLILAVMFALIILHPSTEK